MNARVARRLRRAAYDGQGHHPGPVKHFIIGDPKKILNKNLRGCIVADKERRHYQAIKRAFQQREFVL